MAKPQTKIESAVGDITRQPDLDAIVNAANAQLRIGGGVAGAIHRAAGPELEKETRLLAPIQPGEAVITGGHRLPNRYIIHCRGPVYGADEPSDELLTACYRNGLRVADENGVRSIGFPAISTGAFGFPFEPAAKLAISAVRAALERRSSMELIRFVLFTDQDRAVYERLLAGRS